MKPRITMCLNEHGVFELLINQAGRDLLVRELQALDEKHEHFHMMPSGTGSAEIEVSTRAYRQNDKLIEYGKVLLRTDEWDQEYFPHVIRNDD